MRHAATLAVQQQPDHHPIGILVCVAGAVVIAILLGALDRLGLTS
jgi:hypothetical protein